jgi:hypothetical protein
VIEHLCTQGTVTSTTTYPDGITAQTVKGGMGRAAEPSSIRFLRWREAGALRVTAASFRDTAGSAQFWVVGLRRAPDGAWSVLGAGGGDEGGDPPAERPWANLGGCFGSEGWFYAGGRVIGRGAEKARRVTLTCPDETILEDLVQDRIVLFAVTQGVPDPMQGHIRIYDAHDRVLYQHPFSGGRPRGRTV